MLTATLQWAAAEWETWDINKMIDYNKKPSLLEGFLFWHTLEITLTPHVPYLNNNIY